METLLTAIQATATLLGAGGVGALGVRVYERHMDSKDRQAQLTHERDMEILRAQLATRGPAFGVLPQSAVAGEGPAP